MVDVNHDGRISRAEFDAHFGSQSTALPPSEPSLPPPRQPPTPAAPLSPAPMSPLAPAMSPTTTFDVIDANHDGRISRAEFDDHFGTQAATLPPSESPEPSLPPPRQPP